MIRAGVVVAGLALSGCVGTVSAPDCRDPGLQAFVGQPLSALEASLPEGSYKVNFPLPDGTVTLEDFPDRVRVSVDGDGVIRQLSCG